MANLFTVSIDGDLIKQELLTDKVIPARKVIKGIPEDSKLVSVLFRPVGSTVELMFKTDEPMIRVGNNIPELKVELELVDK